MEEVIEETREVDFVVDQHYMDPFLAIAVAIVAGLIFVAIMAWLSVGIHKADAGTDQWRIWSKRCEQIVNVNKERLRSGKEVTYFEGCPEGPGNEITINR